MQHERAEREGVEEFLAIFNHLLSYQLHLPYKLLINIAFIEFCFSNQPNPDLCNNSNQLNQDSIEPCGSAGKEPACNVGRPGFDPWVGKSPQRRERLPTPEFWPGEFHGLQSPWGHKESDLTERLSLHFTLKC